MTNDTKAPELLPCPFCGKCNLTYRAAQIGDSYYCENCGAYGPLADPDTIKERWNTRHDLHLALLAAAVAHPQDAQAALEADRKRVRKEALREAVTIIENERDKLEGAVVGVKVKPLVWDGLKADTPFGRYDISPSQAWGTGEWVTRVYLNGEQIGETTYDHDTPAAKAAAQADYDRKIRSALEPGPTLAEAYRKARGEG